jgi:hypothetical protein
MGTVALIGAARWLQYAGAMILCGSPLFYLYSFEPSEASGCALWRWPFTLVRVAASRHACWSCGVVDWGKPFNQR